MWWWWGGFGGGEEGGGGGGWEHATGASNVQVRRWAKRKNAMSGHEPDAQKLPRVFSSALQPVCMQSANCSMYVTGWSWRLLWNHAGSVESRWLLVGYGWLWRSSES